MVKPESFSMLRIAFISTLITCLFSSLAVAQGIEDEAVAWLQAFVRVDTVNPPGNESRAVDFYSNIFDSEGIAWQSAESAPGRGNIWARLEGGDQPPLILLQHTDVVPANPKYWSTEPLSGEIHDGFLQGRGTLDMKGTGITQLAAFLSLHRAGKPLNRDVVFVATADEEAGGKFGAGWMTKNRPEVFAGAGLLLNEGGGGAIRNGKAIFGVEVTQKVPVWLRLTAVDKPGHGSSPRVTSAVTRLVDALDRLQQNPFPARIIEPVQTMFSVMAQDAPAPMDAAFRDMKQAVKQPGFLQKLQEQSARLHALTRDTCSVTRLQGSSKINVIPPEAWAEVDCRMLPDRPSADFVADFEKVIAGTGVEVEVLMAFTPAVSSTDTRLFRAIEKVVAQRYPGARIMPSVTTGFTDSHFTRDLGITSYGFNPLVIPESDMAGVHGNDERINVKAFRGAVSNLNAIVNEVVYD
jgi:acetylornithine deacetylase/succinyl-diaminopimelate desuccinylase-like protein